MPSRYIHSRLSSRQVPDLLQAIFVAELMTPSRCLWLVSPWISDIPVIDNSANTFLCLEPSWSRSRVRLSHFLATLAEQGTTVYIATRPDSHNRSFIMSAAPFRQPELEDTARRQTEQDNAARRENE